MGTRRVTLADVARQAGVSVQLVSAVLNGRGPSTVGASAKTRQRVEEAALSLGYRRNSAAASLRTQRHGRIGVLMAGQESGVFLPQGILAGMADRFAVARLGLTLDSVVLSDNEAMGRSRLINEDCVDALVVALAENPTRRLIREIDSWGPPILWMHRQKARNSIGFDEAGAAGALVDHLVEREHEKLHLLDLNAPTKKVLAASQRSAGFAQACASHGIDGVIDYSTAVSRADRAAYARQWLTDHPEPAAVILGSCTAAQVFLDVALQMGRSIPDDLAIATFDSGNLCTANAPAITAAVLSERELGVAAGDMSVALATHPEQALPSRLLPCTVQAGGTT